MDELEQLKNRINKSSARGIKTAHIREDYEPVGQMMINLLTDSGEYVQRKTPPHSLFYQEWRIFRKVFEPY